jgi:protein-S-isoprenylcysteine O-methyltransferase Ste14
MLMEIARFVWWMAAAALVIPFNDVLQQTFGRKAWVERATRQRLVLAVLEVATLIGWVFVRGRWGFLPLRDAGVATAGAVLALTGALFAAWAKSRLGRLFSAHIGVQADHQLITTGPYAVVRHPIYLGLVDFILGSALFWNDVALLAVGILFIAYFTVQIRIEEGIFARHFGEEWERYRATTPALFPRVPRTRR